MSIKTRWDRLWKRPASRWLIGVPVGGFLAFFAGMLTWEGAHQTIDASSSLEFCVSCHEMEAFVYQAYKQTIHYQNAAGVRAVCADCHVPHDLVPKLVRKIQATFNEVPQHLLGKINTSEKFEAHRAEMATSVWQEMKGNDSRECRNCHSYDAMAASMQGRSAAKKHSAQWRERSGDTCIDCHFGIAHTLPQGLTPADLKAKE